MARYKYKRKKKIDLYTIKQNNATVFELYDEQSLQYVVDMAHGLIYKHGIGAAIPAPAMITNDLNIQKLLCGQKIAYVFVNQDKKTYYLGAFRTEQGAAKKYNEKARELYGEYAYQNKVL